MDNLHEMLRTIRAETKARPNHLTVFREFLDHLDRIGRRTKKAPAPKRRPSARKGKR